MLNLQTESFGARSNSETRLQLQVPNIEKNVLILKELEKGAYITRRERECASESENPPVISAWRVRCECSTAWHLRVYCVARFVRSVPTVKVNALAEGLGLGLIGLFCVLKCVVSNECPLAIRLVRFSVKSTPLSAPRSRTRPHTHRTRCPVRPFTSHHSHSRSSHHRSHS